MGCSAACQSLNVTVEQLRAEGYPVRDEDLVRLSPFVRHRQDVHGRYSFVLPTSPTASAFARPER